MPPAPRPDRAKLPYLLLSLAFLAVCFLWSTSSSPAPRDLLDARVYAHAFAAFRGGSDPYSLADGGLPFVYPPLFFTPAPSSPSSPTQVAWAPLPHSSHRLHSRHSLAPRHSIPPRPLAHPLHRSRPLRPPAPPLRRDRLPQRQPRCPALRPAPRRRPHPACAATAGSGSTPPSSSPPSSSPRSSPSLSSPSSSPDARSSPSLATAAITLSAYAAQARFFPTLFTAFQNAVRVQLIVRHDDGFGYLAWFLKLDRRLPRFHSLIAPCAYLAVMAALLSAMLYLRRRTPTPNPTLWLPMLLVFAVIANPRMQAYDAEIAFLPAIVLCIECIRLIPATPAPHRPSSPASLALLTTLLSRDAPGRHLPRLHRLHPPHPQHPRPPPQTGLTPVLTTTFVLQAALTSR